MTHNDHPVEHIPCLGNTYTYTQYSNCTLQCALGSRSEDRGNGLWKPSQSSVPKSHPPQRPCIPL